MELVRWPWSSSGNGDARGARAMAVELVQWRWSLCNGGGACVMGVELREGGGAWWSSCVLFFV